MIIMQNVCIAIREMPEGNDSNDVPASVVVCLHYATTS